ncbi:hypothetical protein KEM48_007645 [Puccinia striiformis f. sp. tritici PST-130]|nr:hypothetical protein KEM48_007645 [Puccinia striiformis f. sp. tritici PST-130]
MRYTLMFFWAVASSLAIQSQRASGQSLLPKQSKPLSSPGSLSYNTWCRLFSNGTREDISPILDLYSDLEICDEPDGFFANATAPVGLRFPKRWERFSELKIRPADMSVISNGINGLPKHGHHHNKTLSVESGSARTMYRLFVASFGSKACQSYHTDSSRTQSAHRWQFQLDSACWQRRPPVDGSDNHGPAWIESITALPHR